MATPDETLTAYIKEMNRWEAECAHRTDRSMAGELDFNEGKEISKREYRRIFDQYCSKRARIRDFHYSIPPDYDNETERILKSSILGSEQAEIWTEEISGQCRRHLYRLLNEDGEWRLLDKLVMVGERWIQANL